MTTAEILRRPLMSGHCAVGSGASHERCQRNGGFQRANPLKEFQPCPCACHYGTVPDNITAEVYVCEGCEKVVVEAAYWPLDEDGETRFTHVDLTLNDDGEVVSGTGRALGENCEVAASRRVSGNEPPPEKDCSRCGSTFRGTGRGRLCPGCIAADEAEAMLEDDFSDLDDLDPDEAFDALLAELDDDDDL